MKDIKNFILESNTSNINTFRKFLKKYKVALQGPDATGIAYITHTMKDEYPFICIDVNDDYWISYLDENEDGTIWVSLDEEGTADEVIDSKNFDKSDKAKNGYTYSEKNAKELANQFLNIINKK